MLNAITTLLVFQLAGEVISQVLGLPVPGPVVGMLMLFLTLLWRGPLAGRLQATAQDILRHLSLLFVPAGVGVMLHLRRITDEWLALGLALVVSTALTVAVTAWAVTVLARRAGAADGEG